MTKIKKPISWIKAARKEFETFPLAVQVDGKRSLAVAAEGAKADNTKPLKGFDDSVMEIVLKHRGDAFRVIYVLQIGTEVWVIHAFQKKSTQGIKTPKHEIDLIRDRIKRLKEQLQ
jgi:phage-related protein